MPTKRQLRGCKKLKNIKKQKQKFSDILLHVVEVSDIILEVLDSRFVSETRNKKIENLIRKKGKKIIYVLNKSDLANKKIPGGLIPYVFVSCKNRTGSRELRDRIKIESSKLPNQKNYKRTQVGVIGYPNSGKSSIINLLGGKSSAKTSNMAGFTKGIQKIKLTNEILLLDSPGVIPIEEYSQTSIKKISEHAKVSARDYNKIKDPEIVVNNLMKDYSKQIEKFYMIVAKKDSEILIEKLGRKLNLLKKQGAVDGDKVARKILKDWQEGKIKIY
ncbi:MAG: 50S ribosome-binding GTPase [Candidatus Pacearchaeota archaeon]|jgi:ribosome biogenesis GTPase A